MRIVVFSDIHGNGLAFETVLADLQHDTYDQMVCLGDAIQSGPQPVQVIARLRELGCPVVMGNADEWLISGFDSGAEQIPEERLQRMEQVRDWQLAQLSDEDKAFIRTFKPTVEIPLEDGGKLLCYHGSPRSFDEVILPSTPEEEVRTYLSPRDDIIYTGGHTHMQFIRHFGRTFHFNPGSVGVTYRHDQPEDHFRLDPWAEYALLAVESGRVELTFRRVPIDVRALLDIYQTSGRPFPEKAVEEYSE